MQIKKLTRKEFENFVENTPLKNHCQTLSYARLMERKGYKYELIGLIDEYGKIKGASLILIKKLAFFKYGYAPKGFILDYFNKELLKDFTEYIKNYYKNKLVFIKINPEIATAEINTKTFKKSYNQNIEIKNYLIELGYTKLKDNLYFESFLPRYNAIVNLKKMNEKYFDKNTRNKIKRATNKGLTFEISDQSGIDILYDFVKRKRNNEVLYYKDYFNTFKEENNIDLFLISIDTNTYLTNAKKAYEKELRRNEKLAKQCKKNKTENQLNIKMNSDQKLLAYKNDIFDAQNKVQKKEKIYIAGALVIKYKNRINIVISGYDTAYKKFNPNYFLHYKILNYYKKYYDFADLNGMTGDFNKENPYYGLNKFKLGFHPKVYEFIGEFDLAIHPKVYEHLNNIGYLAKKLNKRDIKKK